MQAGRRCARCLVEFSVSAPRFAAVCLDLHISSPSILTPFPKIRFAAFYLMVSSAPKAMQTGPDCQHMMLHRGLASLAMSCLYTSNELKPFADQPKVADTKTASLACVWQQLNISLANACTWFCRWQLQKPLKSWLHAGARQSTTMRPSCTASMPVQASLSRLLPKLIQVVTHQRPRMELR